ncbi:GGDEF domain-containing protein [Pseudoalteromonas sp. MMG010]|uniref:GGDEF domain-containing protein n=1 Tax=Pseudoalteromonas sp. MMG010 TaxID=2822685 RepID=UPI001B39F388|nr:GGDEF domain-containing protein [Pseudoalteromonas sp. MMG010]MBQ4833518.1 GGDEF domain-containing protein [Pseudoalteromonas sp. MMG010]
MNTYSDLTERKVIIKLFALIACLTTGFMAIVSFFGGLKVLAIILIVSAIGFFTAFYITSFVNKRILFSSTIVLYNIFLLMLYLVITGGSKGTGIFWIYLVPQVTFFIRGFKRGILDIMLFGIAVIASFYAVYIFDLKSYGNRGEILHFASRIMFSFVIVSSLSGLYEFFRESYSKKLIGLAKHNKLLAVTDPLTKLPNRRHAIDTMHDFKKTQSDSVFSIVLVDVDDFKNINDKYGHLVGDEVLISLADILTYELDNTDLVSRWGGEEFLFVLPHKNKEQAVQATQKIHQALAKSPIQTHEGIVYITVSMGVKEVLGSHLSIDDDVKQADDLLYKAKRLGKNRTCA